MSDHRLLKFQHLGLLAFGLVLAFLVAEGAVRVYRYHRSENVSRAREKLPPIKKGEIIPDAHFAPLIQPSHFEKIVYEFRPHLEVVYLGKSVRLNGQGWRGPNYGIEKAKNTIRMIGLGDSYLFGWALEESETFLAQLENRLKDRFPSQNWESINTGVVGYNTIMEVETLKQRALKYSPDVVLLDYVGNDLWEPTYVHFREDIFSLKKVYLTEFLKESLKRALSIPLIPEKPYLSPRWWGVPPRYKAWMGMEPFKEALEELRRLQLNHGFEILVVVNSDHPAEAVAYLESWSERNGYYYTAPYFPHARKELWVSEKDDHPNALANRLKTEKVFRYLLQTDLLDKLKLAKGIG